MKLRSLSLLSLARILPLAAALLISLLTARSHAAGEVKFLRAQALLNLGRTPTEGLYFDIQVKNLAYAKRVTLHLNNGTGVWTDLAGSYVRAADSQTELWQASVHYYDPSAATATYTFSLTYEAAGMTFVDDNNGKNYTLQVNQNELLLGTPVMLNRVNRYGTASEFYGLIDVQNLSYAKQVTVVYSADNWLTTQSIPAQYNAGPWNGNAEQWSFILKGATHLPIQYAIAYESGGVTYWDNNFGQNYSISSP